MNSPPRRARFQIHLSTAIVLMFVAGGFIWANVSVRRGEEFVTEFGDTLGKVRDDIRGWPCNAVWVQYQNDAPTPAYLSYKNISINASTAIAILFTVWFLCEWLIRRRSARK